MTKTDGQILTGERAAYASRDAEFTNCTFTDGESPLKESRNITVSHCKFGWKYPLWYCKGAKVDHTEWLETGRSGVWYTEDLTVTDCHIGAPKQFRRCRNIAVISSDIPRAEETLWDCENVLLKDVHAVGDYFGMNSKSVKLQNVTIDGNYCFDGGEDIEAHNCVFNSKDAFWNCKDVIIYDSVIIGEYLGWNSQNLIFVNCKIEAHQGLCYINGLKLVNCEIVNTDLAFELCSDIDADITTTVDSIKNPINGIIRCKGIGELISDNPLTDPKNTIIEITGK